jgi:AcrR family transcriptional regulator
MTSTEKIRVTPRAEDTRRRIYEAALALFRQKGFESTTMRDIAVKAEVALGGAYYYFASKEAIVLEFYREMQEASQEKILAALKSERKLRDRLRCILEKRLELLAPNRKFCDALFRHAPDSHDPLSPFSEETRAIREQAIEHLRVAVDGSEMKVSADLKPHLPYLLWLYQMGLILFWLYDHSPRQARTRKLMDLSLGMVVNLIRLSSLPLLRPVRKTVLEMVETISS